MLALTRPISNILIMYSTQKYWFILFCTILLSLQIIYWDEKTIFMEHRFVTPSDGFIRAIAICRQRLLDCSAETVMGTLVDRGVKQNGNVESGVTQVKSQITSSQWCSKINNFFFFYYDVMSNWTLIGVSSRTYHPNIY